jgi:hypothetical protein
MVSGGQDTVCVGYGRGKAWLWRDVGMSGGAVVTLGTRWCSRVTRERERSSGQRWGSGLLLLLSSESQGRGPGWGSGGSTEESLGGS